MVDYPVGLMVALLVNVPFRGNSQITKVIKCTKRIAGMGKIIGEDKV